MAGANVVAILMGIFLGKEVDLGRITDPAWVTGTGGALVVFIFALCVLATIILWINMWVYWSRSGKPILWMFLLLIGAWGPAIAFLFLGYRKDLAAHKKHEA